MNYSLMLEVYFVIWTCFELFCGGNLTKSECLTMFFVLVSGSVFCFVLQFLVFLS